MKVCFFVNHSKTDKDGATLSLINIANEMANRGIEVLLVISNKDAQYSKINKKIKKITVPAFSMRTRVNDYSIWNRIKEKIKIIYNRFSIRNASKILLKEKPDIIHINGIESEVGAEVALKLGIPFIWHVRQLLEEDLGVRLHNKRKIYKLLYKTDAIIAISETVKEKFEKILKRDLKLIYNGIPLDEYLVEEKKPFLSSKTLNILLAGRIVEQKGQLDAVKAVNHLIKMGNENIYLTIVGNIKDINYARNIMEFINENKLHDHVNVIDHVSDLRELRKNCDIGLICSKREAFGRVTIETMASRMLAIGANTGGTAEIIEDNVSGLLYEEGDYLSLANQIKYAMENKNNMDEIIREGYRVSIKNYSISSVVDQLEKLYDEVTE